jgi:hypothetical protein
MQAILNCELKTIREIIWILISPQLLSEAEENEVATNILLLHLLFNHHLCTTCRFAVRPQRKGSDPVAERQRCIQSRNQTKSSSGILRHPIQHYFRKSSYLVTISKLLLKTNWNAFSTVCFVNRLSNSQYFIKKIP